MKSALYHEPNTRARTVPVISEPAMVDVGWMQELGFAGK